MEDTDILNLWKAYDKKLEENLSLNKKNAEDITKIKLHSHLASMKPIKIFTIIVGILWVVFVDTLIFIAFKAGISFFLISAIIQVLLTKLAIGVYIYQLILINRVDISDSILATQEKIATLKSSTIWITKLLFLQFPVWNTFYWTQAAWENGGLLWYIIQIPLTAAFVYLALWMFFNINYENRDKKWFRMIFKGKEWTPLVKSMAILKQIAEYKGEGKIVVV
jgi:hypothetical protein